MRVVCGDCREPDVWVLSAVVGQRAVALRPDGTVDIDGGPEHLEVTGYQEGKGQVTWCDNCEATCVPVAAEEGDDDGED